MKAEALEKERKTSPSPAGSRRWIRAANTALGGRESIVDRRIFHLLARRSCPLPRAFNTFDEGPYIRRREPASAI